MDRSDSGEWLMENLLSNNNRYIERCIDEMSVSTTRISQVSSIVVYLLEVFFETLLKQSESLTTYDLVDHII